ncbi:hypothetical protein HR060_14940 [Catenovulum sp. SM1970]|uniref:hypothetical protein n=1 Tax=Marinifaba aquimaris TaxID=2741323 RepID=UPI0015733422|nr:hypothetical protein [Marinifaba aquimaris]NTS78146.1 hypothetical protein [Marinifaba aquimaris]
MIEKLKSPYSILILSWISLIALTLIIKNGIISAVTIFYTGLLPFLGTVLWLAYSKTGQSIIVNLKKWHFAVILSWFLFAYAIYAQKWAASLLNEIFYVDAVHLGITYTLLAFLFTPFGMIYQENILTNIWNTMKVVFILWGGIFPLLLVLPIPFKKVLKVFGASFLVLSLSSFFIGSVAKLAFKKETLIKRFALWADFNSNHLCTDTWAIKAESVLFLGGDRVLVYTPSNKIKFSPETCNFGKSF